MGILAAVPSVADGTTALAPSFAAPTVLGRVAEEPEDREERPTSQAQQPQSREEPEDRDERRRWWEVSDTIKVALIGAVALLIAGLGTAIWTTHATENAQDSAQRAALEQQRTSFQQQRALADRDELRGLLDEAAAA